MAQIYKIQYLSTFHSDVAQVEIDLQEFPEMAARIFFKLDKILSSLVLMPKMFPMYEDFPIFRKIIIENYLVFYIFDERTGLIEIHRLLYGGMDLQSRFGVKK